MEFTILIIKLNNSGIKTNLQSLLLAALKIWMLLPFRWRHDSALQKSGPLQIKPSSFLPSLLFSFNKHRKDCECCPCPNCLSFIPNVIISFLNFSRLVTKSLSLNHYLSFLCLLVGLAMSLILLIKDTWSSLQCLLSKNQNKLHSFQQLFNHISYIPIWAGKVHFGPMQSFLSWLHGRLVDCPTQLICTWIFIWVPWQS